MSRTNPTDVKNTFDTDLSDSAVEDWIGIATEIVDDVEGVNSSLSNSRLEKIERLLAQHFASSQDPRINSTSRETASVNYQRDSDYATEYMATAVSLDPTGVVASLNKRTATLDVPDARGITDE